MWIMLRHLQNYIYGFGNANNEWVRSYINTQKSIKLKWDREINDNCMYSACFQKRVRKMYFSRDGWCYNQTDLDKKTR